MRSLILLIFLIAPIINDAYGQQAFISKVNGKNRSYLLSYSHAPKKNINLPLVIILHRNGEKAKDSFRSQAFWNQTKKPVIVVFPNAQGNGWFCDEEEKIADDVEFISTIIHDSYQYFQIDRNRVYVLGFGENQCLLREVQSRLDSSIAATAHVAANEKEEAILDETNKLLTKGNTTDNTFALTEAPISPNRISPIDSFKRVSWDKRITLEIRTGGTSLLWSAKTRVTDDTNMDLRSPMTSLGIQLTRWMNDSMAWFLDISRLKVPNVEEASNNYMQMGGGMIFPITVGFKYGLPRNNYRPYFLLGTGVIPIMVFGGKFKSNNPSPDAIRAGMTAEPRVALHTTIGGGVDFRWSKRILVGGHFTYTHSSEFDSVAKIKAIRGFNLSLSAGYILNVKNTQGFKISNNE